MMIDVLQDSAGRMRLLLDTRPAAYGPWAHEIEIVARMLDLLRELIELGEWPATDRDFVKSIGLRRQIQVLALLSVRGG
jgi:hypothetical protein